ncbi:MAG: glycoside hydrolase family 1 protein [Candidatus Dependentiae bacterium]|nr:glycoside hydrolase family 1 protein [Candidatus Dependentiae bacterium]
MADIQSLRLATILFAFTALYGNANTPTAQVIEHLKQSFNTTKNAILNHKKIALATSICAGIAYYTLTNAPQKPLHWDWNSVVCLPQFPQDFLFGAATSAQQVEGNNDNNNWSVWEKKPDKKTGKQRVEEPAGIACNQWNVYKKDIKLLNDIGANAYRFSVEWSTIEPQEGIFDQDAINHYKNVCKTLVAQNIKPCITLHHYTDPIWFVKKGGFEKKENIDYFVRFAQKVFEELHESTHIWFTFNSPDGYASRGWLIGNAPPGKKNIALMAEVYKNILEAHVRTYRTIKETPHGTQAQIGILKNMHQIDPWNAWNPLDVIASKFATKITDSCFFDFFTQGIFTSYIPFKVNVTHTNEQAIGALDFVGINYYSHRYMKNFELIPHPDEPKTDNENYTVYPEGLYRAIEEVSDSMAKPLNIPMYVTENGIATENEELREEFLKKYLCALSHAINDGHDVRGYIHWSLLDNYEWGTYKKKYGLYNVDRATQERTLKPGSIHYKEIIEEHNRNSTD